MAALQISGFFALAFTLVGAASDEPPFRFKSKRADDRVVVKTEGVKTVFDVTSPKGISELVIERTGREWPNDVLVRLRLTGLESFKATSGKVTLRAEVSSTNSPERVKVWVEGKKDSASDPKSPYWMDFKMVGPDGKQSKDIPLRGGYFEMRLPKAFFEGNPPAVTLDWIDFYRG